MDDDSWDATSAVMKANKFPGRANRAMLANLISLVIGGLGLAFVGLRIARDRHEIATTLESADFAPLVAAIACGLAAMVLLGINWLMLIRDDGAPLRWRRGLNWFFVGQLGKYVPGGIWPVIGQAELARRALTPRLRAYSATAWSMVAQLLGAVATAAVAGLIAPVGTRGVPLLLAAGTIICFAAMAEQRIRNGTQHLAQRITKRELRLPHARSFAVTTARHMPAWVLFGGVNVFAVQALNGRLDPSLVVTLIYATCVSWVAGFVIIGLPGGLGVREAVFIAMMTGPLGAGLAVTVAVTGRAVSVAVDLAGAALSVPVAMTAPSVDARD